jgi:hypothetical protein
MTLGTNAVFISVAVLLAVAAWVVHKDLYDPHDHGG